MNTLGYDSERTHRVGRAVLRVLVEHAITLIPIYGTALKVGYDAYKAASEEISRTEKSTLSFEEIKRAVHTLTESEVAGIIVEQLNTDRARRLTQSLSSQERTILKENLLAIPDEMDRVIYEAEQTEERRKSESISNLMKDLTDYLKVNNYRKAHYVSGKYSI